MQDAEALASLLLPRFFSVDEVIYYCTHSYHFKMASLVLKSHHEDRGFLGRKLLTH